MSDRNFILLCIIGNALIFGIVIIGLIAQNKCLDEIEEELNKGE